VWASPLKVLGPVESEGTAECCCGMPDPRDGCAYSRTKWIIPHLDIKPTSLHPLSTILQQRPPIQDHTLQHDNGFHTFLRSPDYKLIGFGRHPPVWITRPEQGQDCRQVSPCSMARELLSRKAAASGVAAKAAMTASFMGAGLAAVCSSLAFRSTAAPVNRALRMPWSSRSWLRAAADARIPEWTEAIPPSGSCTEDLGLAKLRYFRTTGFWSRYRLLKPILGDWILGLL